MTEATLTPAPQETAAPTGSDAPVRVGLRRRAQLALIFALMATVPVIAVSLYYGREVGNVLEHLEAQSARVEEQVEGGGLDPAGLATALATMNETRAEGRILIRRAQRDTTTVLIITVLLTGLLLWRLPLDLLRPLKRIKNGVLRAEQGDYTVPVRIETEDVLGDIARHLNHLFDRLEEEKTSTREAIRSVRVDMDLVGRALEEGVCIVDRGMDIIYANNAFEEMVGADGDLSGKAVADWIPDEGFLSPLRRAFGGGRDEVSLKFTDHRGEVHKRRMRSSSARSPEGDIARVVIVLEKTGLLG